MFNRNLRLLRTKKGYTQQELADYLCISPQSISKWERGESTPSIEFLPKLAEFLECKIDDFFLKADENVCSSTDIEYLISFYNIFQKDPDDDGSVDPVEYMLKHQGWQDRSISFVKSMSDEKYITVQMLEARLACDSESAERIARGLEEADIISRAPDSKYYLINKELFEGLVGMARAAKVFEGIATERDINEIIEEM